MLQPLLIDDKTRVKSMFVLGKPADSTEEFAALFDNQIVVLRDIVTKDGKQSNATKKV